MTIRSPFDPRTHFAAERTARGQTNVRLDGVLTIEESWPIWPDDTMVAFSPCSDCEEWGCNLVDGSAARVRRFGPYVVWATFLGRTYAFDAEAYTRALVAVMDPAQGPESGRYEPLPSFEPDDHIALPEATVRGAHCDRRLVAVAYDCETTPDGALEVLTRWPRDPSIELVAVEPPERALELPSIRAGEPSWWIDVEPRPNGQRAAYLPGLVRAPVWVAGPSVDRALALLLGAT
jgi:hypothetical protein